MPHHARSNEEQTASEPRDRVISSTFIPNNRTVRQLTSDLAPEALRHRTIPPTASFQPHRASDVGQSRSRSLLASSQATKGLSAFSAMASLRIKSLCRPERSASAERLGRRLLDQAETPGYLPHRGGNFRQRPGVKKLVLGAHFCPVNEPPRCVEVLRFGAVPRIRIGGTCDSDRLQHSMRGTACAGPPAC